jgi:hypothetical protein
MVLQSKCRWTSTSPRQIIKKAMDLLAIIPSDAATAYSWISTMDLECYLPGNQKASSPSNFPPRLLQYFEQLVRIRLILRVLDLKDVLLCIG